jgi:DNA invertase Pin-like site-specific DNA recombinase
MTTTTKAPKLIGYFRVSTQKQGVSGLGLEAQRDCVGNYAKSVGGTIIRSYQEIESGAKDDRPELAKAITDARRSKAIIVVGKLDRLARDAHLISGLQKAGVRFVACDMPDADETMIGVYAYFGQRERKLISERTKAAMAVAKSRGVEFGTPENFTQAGREKGAAKAGVAHKRAADDAYGDLSPMIQELREQGLTLDAIASRLNDEGHTTRTGAAWGKMQVSRILKRS